MTGVAAVVDRWRRHHEVSILIAAGAGVGRGFGSLPRAKGSKVNMGPPPQGPGAWEIGGGARPRDVGGAAATGQQSIVPDAVEAPGEHVHQEASDELVGRQRHGLIAARPSSDNSSTGRGR